MTQTQAELALAEELEAARLEGAEPITPEVLELVERYRELSKLIAPYKVEQEAIKELVTSIMKKDHVRALTLNGVEQVALIPCKSQKTDTKALAKDLPEVYAAYVSTSTYDRFDAKK
jgi:translation initiation factor IF-1